MYISRHFSLLGGLRWTFPVIPVMAAWAALIATANWYGSTWLRLPALPVTVLGTAVSFYLGFKGNASYQRLWEARKIWGGIVNTSRTWGAQVTTLVGLRGADPSLADVHQELVYRHIAWLAALRTQLRRLQPWEHQRPSNTRFRTAFGTADMSDARMSELMRPLLAEAELERIMATKNRATQLIHRQATRLRELLAAGHIEEFRQLQMLGSLEELYTLQGKCERIKNFPLPRQYATVNHWFVILFLALLPLALVTAFEGLSPDRRWLWATVPAATVIGWVFYIWDSVLDYSENPFEGLINDIPMNALSRTIEIDLREMLGETELPPPVQAVSGDILL